MVFSLEKNSYLILCFFVCCALLLFQSLFLCVVCFVCLFCIFLWVLPVLVLFSVISLSSKPTPFVEELQTVQAISNKFDPFA